MDSIDFDMLDEMAAESRGGVLGSLEVLQEIAGTVTLAALHDPMAPILRVQFYAWYGKRLLVLRERAERQAEPGYQLKRYDPPRVALVRIDTILATFKALGVFEELIQIGKELAGAAKTS